MQKLKNKKILNVHFYYFVMTYQQFIQQSIKDLQNGAPLPSYFGCLASTVIQRIPEAIIQKSNDSPQQMNQSITKSTTKKRQEIPIEDKFSPKNDYSYQNVDYPTQKSRSSSAQSSVKSLRTEGLFKNDLPQEKEHSTEVIEEEEEEEIYEPEIPKKGTANVTDMNDDIPKPQANLFSNNSSPNRSASSKSGMSPPPKRQSLDITETSEMQQPKKKSKFLVSSSEDENDDNEYLYPPKLITKPSSKVTNEPVDISPITKPASPPRAINSPNSILQKKVLEPVCKPLKIDYVSAFKRTVDTTYSTFWPPLDTKIARVIPQSKIYNMQPAKYPKLIKTIEAKLKVHEKGKIAFSRREATEIEEEEFSDNF